MVNSTKYSPSFNSDLKSYYGDLLKSGRRTELLSHLKADLDKHRLRLRALHKKEAWELVRAHSDYVDEIISLLYYLAKTLWQPEGEEKIAVTAVGGYGRRELCVYSDIDLLFLYENRIDKNVEKVAEEILYFLWDLGFSVGHGCRSFKDSLQLARSELTVCTALIESRYIVGPKGIYDRFFKALLGQVRKQGDNFILEKTKEQLARHAQYDDAVNLLEPNIKESPGGLRDYHLCLWVAIFQYGPVSFSDLFHKNILSKDELISLRDSVGFLLKVRNQLHLSCSRRCDVLAMDYQEIIAEELGYQDEGSINASRKLMQDYYIHANRIRYLSSIFLQQSIKRENKSKRFFSELRKIDTAEGFSVLDGELLFSEEGKNPFENNLLLMMDVFDWCAKHNLALSIDVKRLIQRSLPLIGEGFRASSQVRDVFASILKSNKAADTLRQMHEVHFLGRYIPEFDFLTCLAQRDLYHQFTVDEHTLMAIHHLEKLSSKPGMTELSGVYNELKNPEIVKLALLFHDLGKGGEADHITGSVEWTKDILNRMKWDAETRETVLFLVAKHLEMNYLAQHHDLDDIHIIQSFADTVISAENLRMLYLVSYADLRSVGHEIWNDWKGRLLSNLYHRALGFLEKKTFGDLRQKVLASLPEEMDHNDAEIYLSSLPDRHQEFISAEKIVKHLKLIAKQQSGSIQIVFTQDSYFTELMVCTIDCSGILSRIAGVLASCDVNILGAQVNTFKGGIAIDTLQVTDIHDKPITDTKVLKKLKTTLTLVLEGKEDIDSAKLSGRRFFVPKKEAALPISPRVNLDNTFSPYYSVIQLVCRDRLGLLYDITHSLFEMGINVSMAKITTEAHRAIDTFYATEKDGKKILDRQRQETVKKKLKTLIEQNN